MALTSLSLQRFIACWSRQDLATPISWSALAMNGSALSSSDTEGIHQRPQSVPSDNSCLLIEGQKARDVLEMSSRKFGPAQADFAYVRNRWESVKARDSTLEVITVV